MTALYWILGRIRNTSFSFQVKKGPNNLENLFLVSLSSMVLCNTRAFMNFRVANIGNIKQLVDFNVNLH